MSVISVSEIQQILLNSYNVESEELPQLLAEERFDDVTPNEIAEILRWSGDDEYVTVEDIISERDKLRKEAGRSTVRKVSEYEFIKTINEGGDPERAIHIDTSDDTPALRAFMEHHGDYEHLDIVEMDFELYPDKYLSDAFNVSSRYAGNMYYQDIAEMVPDEDVVVQFANYGDTFIITEDILLSDLLSQIDPDDRINIYIKGDLKGF